MDNSASAPTATWITTIVPTRATARPQTRSFCAALASVSRAITVPTSILRCSPTPPLLPVRLYATFTST